MTNLCDLSWPYIQVLVPQLLPGGQGVAVPTVTQNGRDQGLAMSNTCLVMGGVHAPAAALPTAKCVAGGGGWVQWCDDRGRPYYHHAARQVTPPLDVLLQQ